MLCPATSTGVVVLEAGGSEGVEEVRAMGNGVVVVGAEIKDART